MSANLINDTRLYHIDIPIIGLTGGIATGKSTVSKMLIENGLPLICADSLVKEIYKDNEAKAFIRNLVPDAIINDEINFPALREHFFNSVLYRITYNM